MKNNYTEPVLEIIEFSAEDVITESPLRDDDGTEIVKT